MFRFYFKIQENFVLPFLEPIPVFVFTVSLNDHTSVGCTVFSRHLTLSHVYACCRIDRAF